MNGIDVTYSLSWRTTLSMGPPSAQKKIKEVKSPATVVTSNMFNYFAAGHDK